MLVHTSASESVIRISARASGTSLFSLVRRGSRTHAHKWEVILTGRGMVDGGFSRNGNRNATWDEWGIFLGYVFGADPNARVPGAYQSAEHFHWVTSDRYRELTPDQCCPKHRWKGAYGNAVDDLWSWDSCDKCGAERRWLLDRKMSFSTFLACGSVETEEAPNDYSDSAQLLRSALPGLDRYVKYPCNCTGGQRSKVGNIVMHLNDADKWTREVIADWLETLDVDLTFPTPDSIPSHIH